MEKTDTTIRIATHDDKKQWNNTAVHPLQSWAWGDFRESMGVRVVRLIQEQNGKVEAVYQISLHSLPKIPYTVGYCPRSPLPSPKFLSALETLLKPYRTLSVQFEPNVLKNDQSTKHMEHIPAMRMAHHPLFTNHSFILDMTPTEDQLLSSFHPKTRYNIRLATRHGVDVHEDNSPKAFEEYLHLTEQTTDRQKYYAHNRLYHKNMWEKLHTAGIAKLWTASYKGEILASWIVFVWKDTLYYPYGASSRNHREVMAPNLLAWELIRYAKKNSLQYFDLWGAMGPNPDTTDPWYGFHRFKEGYAPMHVEYVGSYDYVLQSPTYTIYTKLNTLRWKFLTLKKKL